MRDAFTRPQLASSTLGGSDYLFHHSFHFLVIILHTLLDVSSLSMSEGCCPGANLEPRGSQCLTLYDSSWFKRYGSHGNGLRQKNVQCIYIHQHQEKGRLFFWVPSSREREGHHLFFLFFFFPSSLSLSVMHRTGYVQVGFGLGSGSNGVFCGRTKHGAYRCTVISSV